MKVQQYRKKPVVIEAVRLNNDNAVQVAEWCNGQHLSPKNDDVQRHEVAIHTMEGVMVASGGDYIIKGVKGEFYPCKPDIFQATYEAV